MPKRTMWKGVVIVSLAAGILGLAAVTPVTAQLHEPKDYELRPGSAILETCLDCDVPRETPLRGTFRVTREAIGDYTDWYTLHDLNLEDAGGKYSVQGAGEFTTHYTVPLSLGQISLDLEINGVDFPKT